jgi:glycosyltransferase involved in cell wall biosynthesis
MSMPSLSIVIPVFREPEWIGRTIRDVTLAVQRSAFDRAELVVVVADQETREALARIEPALPLRVLSEERPGRFPARQQGTEAATGDLVLLLDARVSVAPDALRFVSDRIKDENDLPIWSAHIDFNRESPYGRFWSVIIPLVWWRYYSEPRTTSFGLEEYDRFSKATTCFLAPRSMLLEAKKEFSSYYADTRNVSDDTGLIRLLAARQRINVSPHFACTYSAHEGYRAFMHNVFHRGKTFVDSYGRPGARFFPLVVAYFPISLLAAVIAVRRPRLAAGAAAATPVAFAAAAAALRRERADVAAVSWVGPNWLAAMSVGLWYGLWLALSARFGRGRGGGAGSKQPGSVLDGKLAASGPGRSEVPPSDLAGVAQPQPKPTPAGGQPIPPS